MLDMFLEHSSDPIFEVELLAVLVAAHTWAQAIANTYAVFYIDNEAAKSALMKSHSSVLFGNVLTTCFAQIEFEQNLFWLWVLWWFVLFFELVAWHRTWTDTGLRKGPPALFWSSQCGGLACFCTIRLLQRRTCALAKAKKATDGKKIEFEQNLKVWFGRVPSYSNPSDKASRFEIQQLLDADSALVKPSWDQILLLIETKEQTLWRGVASGCLTREYYPNAEKTFIKSDSVLRSFTRFVFNELKN